MRRGLSSAAVAAWTTIAVIVALLLLLMARDASRPGDEAVTIKVACAAGLKRPVLDAARLYEDDYGVTIELVYGGSATLLGGIEIKPDAADLYIAADDAYIQIGREKGLLAESIPLARLTPVIAVARGNPHRIESLQDLLEREDLRIGIANPEAAAVGRATQRLLQASGDWPRLEERIAVYKPTVVECANDLQLGAVDAVIIWDATAAQYEEFETVLVPELVEGRSTISAAVVDATAKPTDALRFARYLAAGDRGQEQFAAHGYAVTDGDRWSERPRIVLFAGSMFNQAVEETLQSFAEREGVDIERVYNGCGILVGQMHAGAHPDIYLSCDTRFMDDVQERFLPSRTFSENPMVLITPPGNPAGITGIDELDEPGLRVGLAHPEKSALGALTWQLLEERGMLEPLNASGNWVQQAPQGDFLVNALRTGSLDVAIVYASNAAVAGELITVIPIEDGVHVARQPWAIARNSDHQVTTERLVERLSSESSADRFRALGFRWVDQQDRAMNGDVPNG